jgi:hypothetical protein
MDCNSGVALHEAANLNSPRTDEIALKYKRDNKENCDEGTYLENTGKEIQKMKHHWALHDKWLSTEACSQEPDL